MRKAKYIILAILVAWVAVVAVVRWVRGTPEERVVREYLARFDEFNAEIDRAVAALPASVDETSVDEDALAELQDVRIVLADEAALKEPEEVLRGRIDDPFTARLHYWQPGRWFGPELSSENKVIGVWPVVIVKELPPVLDAFLANPPRYMVVLRPLVWNEPDASQSPIVAGYVEAELYLLDVENARTLASTRFDYDQADQGMITYTGSAQSQAEYDLRSSINARIWGWIKSLVSPEQQIKIESLRYNDGELEEPQPPIGL
jgi:hypothetical protein